MNPQSYAAAIDGIAGSLEEKRWQLADLARAAREEGLKDWAELMAQRPLVSRAKRTVQEWARCADFRTGLSREYQLPFSIYAAVARKVEALGIEKAEEIMDLAQAEQMTVETVQAFVSTLVKPLPPPFSLADWLSDEYLRAEAAIDAAQSDGDIEVLQRVRDALGAEQSRLVPTR